MSKWIVPGLLHRHLTVVAGHPTGGKSTFAYNLAAAYLTGGQLLGQPVAAPSGKRVAFITTDIDGQDDVTDAMLIRQLGHLVTADDLSPVDREHPVSWWQGEGRDLAAAGFGMVVVDNAAGLLGDSDTINSDSDARAVISRMRALSSSGLAVVLLTHSNNTGTFGGSVEWRKSTRCIVKVEGKVPDKYRVIRTQNNTEQLAPIRYRLAADGVRLEVDPGPANRTPAGRAAGRLDERDVLNSALKSSGPFASKARGAAHLHANTPPGVKASPSPEAWVKRMDRLGVVVPIASSVTVVTQPDARSDVGRTDPLRTPRLGRPSG